MLQEDQPGRPAQAAEATQASLAEAGLFWAEDCAEGPGGNHGVVVLDSSESGLVAESLPEPLTVGRISYVLPSIGDQQS